MAEMERLDCVVMMVGLLAHYVLDIYQTLTMASIASSLRCLVPDLDTPGIHHEL